jgi:ABC-type transporter MlaC component
MRLMAAVLVGLACWLHAALVWSGGPRDDLQTAVQRALVRIDDPALDDAQRVDRARAAIADIFDFSNSAPRAFGDHWLALTRVQRRDMSWLFGGFLTDVLVARVRQTPRGFLGRLGERLGYRGESVDGNRGSVQFTWTHGPDRLPLQADMVRRSGGAWRVSDVRIYGVSMIDNYRAQVDRLMRAGQYAEIVERLRDRRAALADLGAPAALSR